MTELTTNQKKWVEALESGDYTQTTGRLKDESGYCCLGVACEISGLGTWMTQDEVPGASEYASKHDIVFQLDEGTRGWTSTSLIREVMDWLDIRTNEGGYNDGESEDGYIKDQSLIIDNDSEDMSFNDIAQIIRDNAYELFHQRLL